MPTVSTHINNRVDVTVILPSVYNKSTFTRPSVVITQQPITQTVAEYSTVTFSCYGENVENVIWYKGETLIGEGNEVSFETQLQDNGALVFALVGGDNGFISSDKVLLNVNERWYGLDNIIRCNVILNNCEDLIGCL